jgi:hypothetical protein
MNIKNKKQKPASHHSMYSAHDLRPVIEFFQLLSEWNAQDVQEKREKSNEEVSQTIQHTPYKG